MASDFVAFEAHHICTMFAGTIALGWLIQQVSIELGYFDIIPNDCLLVKFFMEETKPKVIAYLKNKIGLPMDVIRIIVDDYTFHDSARDSYCATLNAKIKFKSGIVFILIIIDVIIGILFYIACHISIYHYGVDIVSSLITWVVLQLCSIFFWFLILWTVHKVSIYSEDIEVCAPTPTRLVTQLIKDPWGYWKWFVIGTNMMVYFVPIVVYVAAPMMLIVGVISQVASKV